jgi:archaetidylinositol phosphate synthase
METAKREMTFLLAEPERRLLRWIAARLPRWMLPDHLTVLGVGGALLVGAGYALTGTHPGWLWLASGGLLVNWFGDSLDGTLARVREIERPRYGYYIDHMVDAINTAVIGAGIGLSPYVSLPIAMLLVILYLCLSINVYLESSVFGLFELGFGIFGPTEVRLLLVIANAGLYAGAMFSELRAAGVSRVANVAFALVSLAMLYSVLARFRINLIRLSRLEPVKRG